ncbi:MAG: 4'-phosphopantetheinyl transferase superfamily protein [Anaerovoracaceae bacterium]|jgi:phosphopantetheinyl transferase|nr:4'-phosphopantetheinyl transferase superfamily protein [Anaerovoracaceae bacterium]
MIIYCYKGCYKSQKAVLFEKAWDDYSLGRKLPPIIREEKAKPRFEDDACHFSISHSRDYWACVFSQNQVGLDIQYRKTSGRELLIARRFFSSQEAAQVENEGAHVFYKLWTKREALGKYLGTGFFIPQEIKAYPIIKEFTIGDEYQGAIAIEKEEEIWIKTIS